jgi:predicted Zn-dependent protease
VEEVVLGPSAVMTLMEWLALTTFSAKAQQEGRSAFAERMGTPVASDVVTVADDPLAEGVIGLPFDDEGTAVSRVDLITKGVATGVVHDRATAGAAGVAATGHGLPAPNPWGPLARHVVLEPGGASTDELVAGVERGLYVTRFWYTRAVNPKQTRVTGMTRDGTFRIEGGRLGAPVRNLRYNESILDALTSCDGVGATLRTCSDELGDTRVPPLRLRRFAFTAVSDH